MYISSNNWSLSVDLNGGRIKELSFNDQRVFGTYRRIDGKEGNTHICVPSFDKEGIEKYSLPFHGLVRNAVWTEELRTKNSIQISTLTTPSQSYPASLLVTQTFELGSSFSHKVSVVHLTGEPVPVNCAIHYYWDTPQGWEGTRINNTNSETNIRTNGFVKLEEQNIIQFPHAKYQLTSHGFNNAVTWTSFTGEGNEKKCSTDFCCIEPVVGWPDYFGSKESMLNPGETVSASIELKKVV